MSEYYNPKYYPTSPAIQVERPSERPVTDEQIERGIEPFSANCPQCNTSLVRGGAFTMDCKTYAGHYWSNGQPSAIGCRKCGFDPPIVSDAKIDSGIVQIGKDTSRVVRVINPDAIERGLRAVLDWLTEPGPDENAWYINEAIYETSLPKLVEIFQKAASSMEIVD